MKVTNPVKVVINVKVAISTAKEVTSPVQDTIAKAVISLVKVLISLVKVTSLVKAVTSPVRDTIVTAAPINLPQEVAIGLAKAAIAPVLPTTILMPSTA